MCVIIYRKPGTEIPHDLIANACGHNPDGFGYCTVDRGKIDKTQYYDPKGNDPEAVMRALEATKDVQTYLHLRRKTAGKIDTSNCHPFTTLNVKEHGFQVEFFHNGHISEYAGNSDKSDTRLFNDTFLKPFLAPMYAYYGEECLDQPVVEEVLKHYLGGVFLLVDQNGKTLEVANQILPKYEWGFASNTYSFRPSESSYQSTKKTTTYFLPPSVKSDKKDKANDNTKPSGNIIFSFNGDSVIETSEHMESFVEIMGLNSLDDLYFATPDGFHRLCKEFPDQAALLISELLKERWDRNISQ